jgi:hypothetical protein
MVIQKILLPYNFTSHDKKALDFVIQTYANQKDVEITLFNAYMPVPEIETRTSPIMEKMRGNLGFLLQKIKEQEEELNIVRNKLLEKGFSENRIHTIFEPKKKDVAGEINDLALNGQFDVVVLNRKPGKIARFFTGSVFTKVVLALKETTVCIVS